MIFCLPVMAKNSPSPFDSKQSLEQDLLLISLKLNLVFKRIIPSLDLNLIIVLISKL